MSYIIPGADRARTGTTRPSIFIDNSIRTGIVFEELRPGNDGETLYTVMVTMNGNDVPITCTRMSQVGGVNNYEEYNYRGYRDSLGVGNHTGFRTRAGETVVVALLDGSGNRGIILGGVRHPARKELLEANGKTAYARKINGIEEKITEDGVYTITNKGIAPGSDSVLDLPPTGATMAEAQDDPLKGSSYGFDANGNFNISDGGDQTILVEKDSSGGGSISLTSGSTTIVMGSGVFPEITMSTEGDFDIAAEGSINMSGLGMSLIATDSIAIESSVGISITAKGSELLDLITQLVDEMGSLVINSPNGPCAPFSGAPTWAKVVAIQQKIKLMMG